MEVTLEMLREIEDKWQKIWREKGIYNAEVDESKPKFFITVPYPYTSGPLHIGHGRTYIIGDIIARFKRLCGYNVLFPMAFHVTGMPVLSISDRIARGNKEVIRMYREYVGYYVKEGIDEIIGSFKDPMNVAKFFAENIRKDFERIGLGIDWRRRFHTAERYYNKFVEWQYKKLKEHGLIVKGEHFVRYCLLHNQSVGEDDIADGDVNPVRIQEFVAIKFKYKDGYILASTLRPETIYGATNMWVNPNATYLKISTSYGENWYISKEAFEKIMYQYPDDYKKIEELSGESFVGGHVVSPLGDKLIILPASFVDPDIASGFVYSEPADAPYDFVALEDLKKNPDIVRKYGLDPETVKEITPKKIIDVPGIEGFHAEYAVRKAGIKNQLDPKLEGVTEEVYKEQFYYGVMNENTGELAGVPVREAREKVRRKLLEEGNAIIFYETSRKAVCRGGGKIIVARIKDQWFIDYSQEWWKNKSKEWLRKMKIIPQKYRKLFEDTIDWLSLRPCARGRGLGTKLPFDKNWVIESLSDSTIYMAFYTIAHIIRAAEIEPDKLIPEVFDYVFLGEGDAISVSKKSGIPVDTLNEMRRSFEYWYPNDLRHTATPHITNHLTFFIMHHVAIFPSDNWPRAISLNETVIREGKKISKSRGNVIPLADISKKYSADLFRLYVASGADLDGIVDWREADVENLKKSLLNFASIVLEAAKLPLETGGLTRIDRWFLSRFYRRLEYGKEQLENFKIRDFVVSMFYEVMNDLNYHKRRSSRDRNLSIVRIILEDWITCLSPIIPHICEEVWSIINKDPSKWSINMAQWPEPKVGYIDKTIEVLELVVMNLVDLGRNLLRVLKMKPRRAIIVIAAKWKYELFKVMHELISTGERRMGVIMKNLMRNDSIKANSKEASRIVQRVLGGKIQIPDVIPSAEDEFAIIGEAKEYICDELGVGDIEIIFEENSEENIRDRATRALPARPIIIFQGD